jgi:hypothetical protein
MAPTANGPESRERILAAEPLPQAVDINRSNAV